MHIGFGPFGLFHTTYDVNEFESTRPVVTSDDITNDDYKSAEVAGSHLIYLQL